MKTIKALYISPTGNTKKAVNAFCKSLAEEMTEGDYKEDDITAKKAREEGREFSKDDVVVVGCPTYAGRLPNKLMPYLRDRLEGNGAKAIALVTYGNRAYDDALRELAEVLEKAGFDVAGALAVPAEHAFAKKLATGRPDMADIRILGHIAADFAEKLGSANYRKLKVNELPGRAPEEMRYYEPKREDGEAASFLKVKPVTDESLCDDCGRCRQICPMGCYDNGTKVAEGICIKCHGCISVCPNNAKAFTDGELLSHKAMLEANFAGVRKQIEAFGV
ncbi:MAG: ferredoxin [Clostridia bacterium]|nr:ferredoxin [Clostridia bacterium]